MNKSKRIFYLDVMRLMAIIGIIFCHASITYVVSDMGTANFYVSAFFDCFRDFCVPIFVMLSGALLIGKRDSLITFFKKRLSRILIPFIFWAAISTIYSFIYLKHSIDIDNAIAIFSGHGGTMGVTFWFIWMIIIVYIGIFSKTYQLVFYVISIYIIICINAFLIHIFYTFLLKQIIL